MVGEGLLHRDDRTGKRGSKVYFSSTQKCEKKYGLKIIGTNAEVKRRRRLYNLLIFFEVFRSKNPVTESGLFRFLKQVGISKNDLEIAKEYNASFPRVTHYRHIKNVAITRWIQSEDTSEALYHITIPGFTIKEVASSSY